MQFLNDVGFGLGRVVVFDGFGFGLGFGLAAAVVGRVDGATRCSETFGAADDGVGESDVTADGAVLAAGAASGGCFGVVVVAATDALSASSSGAMNVPMAHIPPQHSTSTPASDGRRILFILRFRSALETVGCCHCGGFVTGLL